MKTKVIISYKCMRCGEVGDRIYRDKDFKPTITDDDVRKKIMESLTNPYTILNCEKCGMETLQMRVGWNY